MSLGEEMMSHLCQRLSTLTSRKFIRAPDPTLSVQPKPRLFTVLHRAWLPSWSSSPRLLFAGCVAKMGSFHDLALNLRARGTVFIIHTACFHLS